MSSSQTHRTSGPSPSHAPTHRSLSSTVQGDSFHLSGEFEPGYYRIDLATRGGLGMDTLFVHAAEIGNRAQQSLNSAEDLSGPWDQIGRSLLLPMLEVRIDGELIGKSWADLPGLEDLPAGVYRFSTGVEIESSGRHEIVFRPTEGEDRLTAGDFTHLDVAVDERHPTAAIAGMDKRIPGHPCILLTPERIEKLRKPDSRFQRELLQRMLDAGREPTETLTTRSAWQAVEALALAAAIDPEPSRVNTAFQAARSMLELPHWGHGDNPDAMGCNNDIAAGTNLYALTVVCDWLWEQLGPERREELLAGIRRRGRVLYRFSVLQRDYWPTGYAQNHLHGSSLGLGLAGLMMMEIDPEFRKWAVWVRSIYERVRESYAADGSVPPVTDSYGLQFIARYQEGLRVTTGEDLFDHPQFRLLPSFLLHNWTPGRHMHSAGLRLLLSEKASVGAADLRRLAVRHLQAPDRGQRDTLAAVFYREPPVGENSLPKCQYFADGGYVFMGGRWQGRDIRFSLRCGPMLGHSVVHRVTRYDCAHYEPDAGTFRLWDGEHPIVPHVGQTYRKCTHHYAAITVNETGQFSDGRVWSTPAPPGRHGRICHYSDTPARCLVACELAPAYPDQARLERLRRWVLFIKPCVFVFLDDVQMQQPQPVDWWLPVTGRIDSMDGNCFRLGDGKDPWELRMLRPARIEPRIASLLVVRAYTNYQDVPTSLRIRPAGEAKELQFVSMLAPMGAVTAAEALPGEVLLQIPQAPAAGVAECGGIRVRWAQSTNAEQ